MLTGHTDNGAPPPTGPGRRPSRPAVPVRFRPHLPRSSPVSRTSASLRSAPGPALRPRLFRHTSRQLLDFRQTSRSPRKSRPFRYTPVAPPRTRPFCDHALVLCPAPPLAPPLSVPPSLGPAHSTYPAGGSIPAAAAGRFRVRFRVRCSLPAPARGCARLGFRNPPRSTRPRPAKPPAAPGAPVRDEGGTVRGSVPRLRGANPAHGTGGPALPAMVVLGCGTGDAGEHNRDSVRCGRGGPSGSFHGSGRPTGHRDALSLFAGHREHFLHSSHPPPAGLGGAVPAGLRGGGRRSLHSTAIKAGPPPAPNRAVTPTRPPPPSQPGEPPGRAPPAARRCGRGGALRSWHRRRWDGTKRSAALRRRHSSSARTAIRAPRGGEGRGRTDGRRRPKPRNRGDTAGRWGEWG